jgi:hypothetical protein
MNEDAVWEALARALSGEYEILARLGLGAGGAPVYLARELVTDSLVALRLPPLVSGNDGQEYGLEVVRQIDPSLPEIETRCSHCGATLRQWARFCSKCGRDVSGLAPSAAGQTRDQLRALARETAAGKYEILGEMPRAEGGGLVYFGRELSTDRVVGLQLEPGPEATLLMTATQFAMPDPSFQLAETRRPSGEQQRRVSSAPTSRPSVRISAPMRVSAGKPTASNVGSERNRTWTRVLTVSAIVLLLVLVAMTTCQIV